MKISRIIFVLFLSLLLVCCNSNAQTDKGKKRPIPESKKSELEKKNFPKAIFIVNDFEHLLTDEEILDLEILINDFKIKTQKEIVVITVNTIEPYSDIKSYSLDLSNYLGIGKDGNGLTIVVCNAIREIQISTGIITEKVITDQQCQRVLDEFIVPNFKNEKYYEGLKAGLTELIKTWN